MLNKKYFTLFGIVFSFALIFGLTACTWEELKVKMQYNPEVGETYHVFMTSDQVISQTYEGQNVILTQTIGMGYSMAAVEKDEQGIWMDITYDRIVFKQIGPMGEVAYDSDNPPAEVPAQALGYKALLGNGFSVKTDPAGKIIEVKNFEAFIDGVLKNLNIEDESTLEQVRATIEKQYNEESIKEMVGNALIQYPEGEVKIGDSWTSQITMTISSMALSLQNNYVLSDYKDNTATIQVTSQILNDPNAAPLDLGAYQMKYALEGLQTGQITVDTLTGCSMNSTITQTMSGTVSLIMGTEAMTLPITINGVTHVEIAKK